jgi:HEAT repeat protein
MEDEFQKRLREVAGLVEGDRAAQTRKEVEAISAAGARSFEDMLGLLRDPRRPQELRETVCWVLARWKDPRAAPVLVEALEKGEPGLRACAARSLGEMGASEAVRPLAASLYLDEDAEVRFASVYALGLIGDVSALRAVALKLGDTAESVQIRGMAAEALGDIGDARAIPYLVRALEAEQPELRYWAAFALGAVGNEKTIPLLERLAADQAVIDRKGTVGEEAAEAVERIRGRLSEESSAPGKGDGG